MRGSMVFARTIRVCFRLRRRPARVSVGPNASRPEHAAPARVADDAYRLYRRAPLVARGYSGTPEYTARSTRFGGLNA